MSIIDMLNKTHILTAIPVIAQPLSIRLQLGFSPVLSLLHLSGLQEISHWREHVIAFDPDIIHMLTHELFVQPVQPLIERQLPLLFTSETHFLVASQAQHVAMEAVETHLSVFGSFLICAQTPLKQLESAPSTVHAWPAFFLQTNAVPSRDAVVPAEPQEIVSAEHLNKEDWITGQHLLEWQSEFWEHGSPLLGTQLTAPETSTVGIVFDKAGQSGSALLQRKSAESFSFMHLNWQSGSGFAQSSPSSLLQDGCSPVDSDLHRSNEASQDSSVVLQFAEHVNTFVLEAMQKFAHPDESAVQPVQPLIERQLPLLFTSETHFLVASQAQHVAMEAVETHLSVFGSFLICAQTPLKRSSQLLRPCTLGPRSFCKLTRFRQETPWYLPNRRKSCRQSI
ncbi:Hypothetical_protein [Hexamita inflata]|uniref:Hypothetical_protein n=1 Tax=Hexamita inflata TaxID=28002 RepID=A0AA86UEE1_9EUKA|nr:Hypothetical protein HINF_LOCUS35507 [Hexamita inflata]